MVSYAPVWKGAGYVYPPMPTFEKPDLEGYGVILKRNVTDSILALINTDDVEVA